MSSVNLKGIYKRYAGGVEAVKDFNIDIPDKEFVVLLGPSGCGKSTTLRMIAGLEEITEGELLIDDKIVNDVLPKDRDIAMVFQNYALYPHMTVYENMAFGLKRKRTPKAEIKRRVTEAAKILDIEHLLDRKPKALSGGQRQRVALGRAIVREPKVFLMDEPLSNLDAKLRTQMRAEISKLHKRLDTTFIYVTHDQIEALTMGTIIVVMKDGIIQQISAPQDLYDKPANLFVAGFIGTPRINTMDVMIEKREDGIYAAFGDQAIKLNETKAKALEAGDYIGKEVVLAIRPESVHDEQMFIAAVADSTVEATVDLAEAMGSETYLYFQLGGAEFIARVNARTTAKMGDTVKFAFEPESLHFFNKETELLII